MGAVISFMTHLRTLTKRICIGQVVHASKRIYNAAFILGTLGSPWMQRSFDILGFAIHKEEMEKLLNILERGTIIR